MTNEEMIDRLAELAREVWGKVGNGGAEEIVAEMLRRLNAPGADPELREFVRGLTQQQIENLARKN